MASSVGQCFVTFPAYFFPDLALAAATGAMPWWKQRAYTATVMSAGMWTAAATAVVAQGLVEPVGPGTDGGPATAPQRDHERA